MRFLLSESLILLFLLPKIAGKQEPVSLNTSPGRYFILLYGHASFHLLSCLFTNISDIVFFLSPPLH